MLSIHNLYYMHTKKPGKIISESTNCSSNSSTFATHRWTAENGIVTSVAGLRVICWRREMITKPSKWLLLISPLLCMEQQRNIWNITSLLKRWNPDTKKPDAGCFMQCKAKYVASKSIKYSKFVSCVLKPKITKTVADVRGFSLKCDKLSGT